jgi:hypothetical protein
MDPSDVYAESAVDDLVRGLEVNPNVRDVVKRREGDFFVVTFTNNGVGFEWRLPAAKDEAHE